MAQSGNEKLNSLLKLTYDQKQWWEMAEKAISNFIRCGGDFTVYSGQIYAYNGLNIIPMSESDLRKLCNRSRKADEAAALITNLELPSTYITEQPYEEEEPYLMDLKQFASQNTPDGTGKGIKPPNRGAKPGLTH